MQDDAPPSHSLTGRELVTGLLKLIFFNSSDSTCRSEISYLRDHAPTSEHPTITLPLRAICSAATRRLRLLATVLQE